MAVTEFVARVAQWVAKVTEPAGVEGVCYAADATEYGAFA